MKNKKSPLNFANLLDPTNLAGALSTKGLNMSNPRARQIARQRRNQIGLGRGLLGNIGGAVGGLISGGLFGNNLLKGRTDEYKGSNTYGDAREFDALINKPQVLFLDEPTASLDPEVGDFVRTFLETYKQENKISILLASHNMNEVSRLCKSVLMMKNGQIIDNGSPESLIAKHGRKNLEEVFLKLSRSKNELD